MADNTAGPAEQVQLVARFQLDSLIETRHRVEEYGSAAGLTDIRLYKFVVAVNEIMTNAVHHGGGTGELRLWRDADSLHCRVADHGPGIAGGHVNGHHRPDPGTIGGWGLWLTRQICDRIDIDTSRAGTTVTFAYRIQPPA